jgi:hypothetical protein
MRGNDVLGKSAREIVTPQTRIRSSVHTDTAGDIFCGLASQCIQRWNATTGPMAPSVKTTARSYLRRALTLAPRKMKAANSTTGVRYKIGIREQHDTEPLQSGETKMTPPVLPKHLLQRVFRSRRRYVYWAANGRSRTRAVHKPTELF